MPGYRVQIPVDRPVACGVRRAVGIVRRIRSAAEQIEFVTQDSRSGIDRRLHENGMVLAQGVESSDR